MTHVKAQEWIKRLPEGRGQPLDAGSKLLLMELWNRVDWSRESDAPARDCYPSRRRLAEDTGTTVVAVKSRLIRLAAAGWIRREQDGWALAWARPWPVEPATTSPDEVATTTDHARRPGGCNDRPRLPEPPSEVVATSAPGCQNHHIPSQNQANDQPHDRDRSAPPPEPDPLDAVFAERGDLLTECPDCGRETEHVTLGADRVQCSACGRAGSRAVAVETRPSPAPEPAHQPEPAPSSPMLPLPCRMCAGKTTLHEPESAARARCSECGHVRATTAGKAKRKAAPPRAGQAALELGTDPEARDVVAELLELHGRLRAEAQAHHGERVTELPSPVTRVGSAMRKGCRQAVRERSEAWCREMLAWRGRQWLDDASQLEWSTSSVWTRPSLDQAAKRMAAPARAAPARRGPTLSAPPPGEIPKYQPSPTTDDESEEAWSL